MDQIFKLLTIDRELEPLTVLLRRMAVVTALSGVILVSGFLPQVKNIGPEFDAQYGIQFGLDYARAQQQGNIFQRLFGSSPKSKAKPKPRAAKTKKRVVRRKKRARTAASSAVTEKTQKVENARTILVAGDFLAGALARGLVTAFEQDASVVVVNKFKGDSGIARADYYDWPSELGQIIDEVKPVAVVFLAGANDRQTMRLKDSTYEKLSDGWVKNYKQRVSDILQVTANKRVPLFWVSNPPVKSGAMSRDYLAFNSLLKGELSVGAGQFIDIWDKFSNDENEFTRRGPDINGQEKTLRTKDGINFTKSGRRKLAFYVEQPLQALLDGQPVRSLSGFSAPIASFDIPAPVEKKQSPSLRKSTPVIAMNQPDFDGGDELAGGKESFQQLVAARAKSAKQAGKPEETSPQEALIVRGLGLQAPEQRVDNFEWNN